MKTGNNSNYQAMTFSQNPIGAVSADDLKKTAEIFYKWWTEGVGKESNPDRYKKSFFAAVKEHEEINKSGQSAWKDKQPERLRYFSDPSVNFSMDKFISDMKGIGYKDEMNDQEGFSYYEKPGGSGLGIVTYIAIGIAAFFLFGKKKRKKK
jgi:hypothetical protein